MIAYILEVTLYWTIFCALYHFTLRKLTFFRFNRWFLLGSMILGLILPLIFFEFSHTTPIIEDTIYVIAPISNTPAAIQNSFNSSPTLITFSNILLLIYWSGVVAFTIQFMLGLIKIARLYKRGSKTKKINYTLVRTTDLHLPFSFFNYIFWSNQMDSLQDGDEKIMIHELSHVKDGHSFDVLFMEVVKIFLWCSPLVYWYHKSIKQIHEYIADHAVLKTTHKKKYGNLLLNQSRSGMQIALANHFIQSQLKNRITMMLQKPSSRKALLKYLWLLPLMVIMALLISAKEIPQQTISPEQSSVIEKVRGNYPKLQGLIVLLQGEKPTIFFRIFEYESSLTDFLVKELNIKKDDILTLDITENNEGSPARMYPDMVADQYLKVVIRPDVKIQFESSEVIIKESSFLKENEAIAVDIFNERVEIHKISRATAIALPLTQKDIPTKEDLSSTIETQPRFPGCDNFDSEREKELCAKKQLLGFIYKNIKYPAEAREAGIEGVTVVTFDVDIDGTLKNFKLDKDIGGGTGEESLRVARLLEGIPGKWTPATLNGNPVKAQFKLPIRFKLSDNGNSTQDNIKVVLFFKNGSKLSMDHIDLKKAIKPDDIIEVNVLKGESMQEKYPEFAESDGVIEIFTRWSNADLFKQKLKEASKDESTIKPKPEIEELFKVVEEMPRFPGCEQMADKQERDECSKNNMLQFIYENIKYPIEAKNAGIQGVVVVQFVVERDGSLSNIKVVREIGGGAGVEGARVVATMNNMDQRWTPGRQRGKEVRVLYNLPIRFKLSDDLIKEGIEEKKAQAPTPEANDIFKVVEEMPRFPGCEDVTDQKERQECAKQKMLQYIFENIKYPTEAKDAGIEGMVVIRFVVEKDGSLTNIEIVRDIGGGTGAEGKRLVEGMNEMDQNWIPGRQRGEAVRVQYNLPFRFKLSDENSESNVDKVPKNNKLELDNVLIFPNPTSQEVQVTFSAEKKPLAITLYDLNGKEIYQESLQTFDGLFSQKINVEDAARGFAIITIKQENRIFTTPVLLK